MIEILVLNFLSAELSEPVCMEVPTNPPKRFVVLRKADSSREDMVDTAMFVVNSHAESLLEAARLNEQVLQAMDKLTDLDEISACKRAGDYNFTDTASKRYRYQAVFNVTY